MPPAGSALFDSLLQVLELLPKYVVYIGALDACGAATAVHIGLTGAASAAEQRALQMLRRTDWMPASPVQAGIACARLDSKRGAMVACAASLAWTARAVDAWYEAAPLLRVDTVWSTSFHAARGSVGMRRQSAPAFESTPVLRLPHPACG